MPKLIVPANVTLCQVDVPEGAKRSREGSVHIRPASVLTVTDDELAAIKNTYPDVAKRLILIQEAPSLAQRAAAKGGEVARGLAAKGRSLVSQPAASTPSADEAQRVKKDETRRALHGLSGRARRAKLAELSGGELRSADDRPTEMPTPSGSSSSPSSKRKDR